MMPMSSPGWFNDLPEYMTEAEYRDLSEEISAPSRSCTDT